MKSISKVLIPIMMLMSQISLAQVNLAQSPIEMMAMSRAGHRGGNGGNSTAAHFSTIANNIVIVWEDICKNQKDTEAYCNYVQDLKSALNKDSSKYVVIKAQDDSETFAYDGQEREAINNGVNEIIVNTHLWNKMNDDLNESQRQISLVLHEYFSVMELDSSDNYSFSTKVIGVLSRKHYDLKKISQFEVLPSSCSIKTSRMNNIELNHFYKSGLGNKNYSLKNSLEKTRYELDLINKCNDSSLTTACAIHAQLKDNYTGTIVYDQILVNSAIAKSESKLINSMNEEVLNNIKTCNN